MTQLNRRAFLGTSATLAAGSSLAPLAGASTAAVSPAAVPAYGPNKGVAKLNANENPYGPSKAALVQMYEASKLGSYYVGESVAMLKAMIAERNNVTPEHITLSSGSSGVLSYLAVAVSQSGKMLGPALFWIPLLKPASARAGRSSGCQKLTTWVSTWTPCTKPSLRT